MIAIELCLPPKVNASEFERTHADDSARRADDVALGPAVVVAPGTGTPTRLVAAEQPAGRQDHPALEATARPRARVGQARH